MNYRNLSMDELTTFLTNEPDPDRFIEASKELVERIVDKKYHSQKEFDDAVEAAYEKGRTEMQRECQDAIENA